MSLQNNFLIVLTGKTASGKDTVMAGLLKKYPAMGRVVTTTSRAIRNGETQDTDYHFIPREEFLKKIEKGDFIEYVEYAGNLYGTEKKEIAADKPLIWRIDPSRAGQIKSQILNKQILVIYLTADDSIVLERLRKRGLPEEEIRGRMEEDSRFWQQFHQNYDFVIENVPDRLHLALDKIVGIIENHAHK